MFSDVFVIIHLFYSSISMTYIGIDVSKATFTVAYSSNKSCKIANFNNDTKGIQKFIRTLSPKQHHCVMEATGNYSLLLAYMLSKAGITTSVENPYKVKCFAKTMMYSVKTDEVDARMIALYGEKINPEPYKMRAEDIMKLKQKRSFISLKKRQLVATKNHMESVMASPFADSELLNEIEVSIKQIEDTIKKIENEIVKVANSIYEKQMSLLTTIKGISNTMATALIIATGGFTLFDNAKQFTKYIGLSPAYEESGTSVKKPGHINRSGDPVLRSQIYVCAMASLRVNTECKACFDKLKANGKPGKVATIAVANKLIRQAFAVIKNETPYIDGFVSTHPSVSKHLNVSGGDKI